VSVRWWPAMSSAVRVLVAGHRGGRRQGAVAVMMSVDGEATSSARQCCGVTIHGSMVRIDPDVHMTVEQKSRDLGRFEDRPLSRAESTWSSRLADRSRDVHQCEGKPRAGSYRSLRMLDDRGGHVSGLDGGESPRIESDPLGEELGAVAGAVTGHRIHDQSIPSGRCHG